MLQNVYFESLVLSSVTVPHWEAQLKQLLEQHLAETGSAKTKEILHRWDEELAHFVQVCPKEMLNRLAHPLSLQSGQKTA